MNRRFRTNGAPIEHAEIVDHSASNPIAQRSPMTLPNPRSSSPGTFSTMTIFGRISHMIRLNSRHNPERSPSIPIRLPATETSWQGKPPQITSHCQSVPSRGGKVHTSSCRRTFGQCFSRTRLAYSSFSTCQTHRIPARSKPRSNPPIPEKSEPNVICRISPIPLRRPTSRVARVVVFSLERLDHSPQEIQHLINPSHHDRTPFRLQLTANHRRHPFRHHVGPSPAVIGVSDSSQGHAKS